MSRIDDMHAQLNATYAERKLGRDVGFRAPECRPVVQSDQVLALLEVVDEYIGRLEARIAERRTF